MANENTVVQEVPNWTGTLLANGEFLNYTKAIVGALNGLDHTKVPVGEPLAELDATNQRLTDFINESRQYASTSEIARQDARRDAYFKAMWRALEQLEELGEDVPAGASAHLVLSKIGTYKGAYARTIAGELAKAAGVELGEITLIEYGEAGGAAIGYRNMVMAKGMECDEADFGASGIEAQARELSVGDSVSIRWKLEN